MVSKTRVHSFFIHIHPFTFSSLIDMMCVCVPPNEQMFRKEEKTYIHATKEKDEKETKMEVTVKWMSR